MDKKETYLRISRNILTPLTIVCMVLECIMIIPIVFGIFTLEYINSLKEGNKGRIKYIIFSFFVSPTIFLLLLIDYFLTKNDSNKLNQNESKAVIDENDLSAAEASIDNQMNHNDSKLMLRNINKIYPNNVQAVFDFNLDIADKEFIVFVGPSGCGKSTTLRMIAGLEEITSGELYIDNRLVNSVVPQERGVAMVFQNYALYPHMTVKDNISFALKHCKLEMPLLEMNEQYYALTNEMKTYLKQIDAIDRKINKKKVDKDIFAKRDEIYKQFLALYDEREQYTQQIEGRDETRIKRVNQAINQIKRNIHVLANQLNRYGEIENHRSELETQIKETKMLLAETNKDLSKVEENDAKYKEEYTKRIKTLNDRLVQLNKSLERCENTLKKAVVIKTGIDDRKKQLVKLYRDLEFLQNNNVPLFKRRKMKWHEIYTELYKAVDILDLKKYLYRKPAALSGGQRQRVALGRTIVRHPKVFLMDEPLSNLDAKLRVQTRSEISKIHKRVGATTVYVTHDQTEAMTMADRIVVMKDGYIQQIGTPGEVFSDPANVFVAGFIGNPPTNFINAKYEKGKIHFGNNCVISVNDKDKAILKEYDGKEIILGVRPENIYLANDKTIKSKTNPFKLKCEFIELLGYEIAVYFSNEGRELIMKIPGTNKVQPEDELEICFDKNSLLYFDAETEWRIK